MRGVAAEHGLVGGLVRPAGRRREGEDDELMNEAKASAPKPAHTTLRARA